MAHDGTDVELLTTSLTVAQLAPTNDQLPRCRAECRDGTQCMFSARYAVNGVPMCGQHVGRPSVVFHRRGRG